MNKRLLPLLLVVLTTLIAACTIVSIGKASSEIPYLTQKVIGRYGSYKYVKNSGDDYYVVGGHKYGPDVVHKSVHVSNSQNHQANVVVKDPVMKSNLSAHQKGQIRSALLDWKRDNTFTDNLFSSFNPTPSYSKWSLHRLFKDYQKSNISVVINKN